MTDKPSEFSLDMSAEIAARSARQSGEVGSGDSTEIAAKIGELMRAQGLDDQANPMAAEKLQRDLMYQRQIETIPQPDDAPIPTEIASPGIDRLEEMQKELEAARAEATRWKKEFGRREGKVGGMEARIKELEARVAQVQPTVDVRQITGREPHEAITAQDAVALLMSQSQAFGNKIRQVREEILASRESTAEPGLPLDMEAELVEAHPWLTDLPRPQKMRAMHDILSSAGVTVAPQIPASQVPNTQPTSSLPAAAKTAVRQAAFIEPSNRGSQAEKNSVIPERQALNDKVAKIRELLTGPYRPGQSDKAAELLASLGAGPVDDTQQGFFTNRR